MTINFNSEFIRRVKHPTLPLYLLKYTQECVYNQEWNDATLMARGLVIDDNDAIIANCIPKFFNIEELNQQRIPKINLSQPFTATVKDDGSLIQVFMYNDDMVITSSGGFDNQYTQTAESLLISKYQHLLPIIQTSVGLNFIFELITPFNQVVVNYGGVAELRLITVRDVDGVEDEDFIQQCIDLGFDHVEKLPYDSLNYFLEEKQAPSKNREGYVLKFSDGSRVKIKYAEYIQLHKLVTKINKHYVWETLKNTTSIDLELLPDEVFNQIKIWDSELREQYRLLCAYIQSIYDEMVLMDFNTRKDIANWILSNHPRYAKLLFCLADKKDITGLLWDYIEPKLSDVSDL